MCLSPHFSSPSYRRLRTATFVLVGSTSALPFLHAVLLNGFQDASASMGFRWIAVEMACYVLGAVVYAERCPERWRPGAFDLWGASHQVFHVLAVLAIAAQYASGESSRGRCGLCEMMLVRGGLIADGLFGAVAAQRARGSDTGRASRAGSVPHRDEHRQ